MINSESKFAQFFMSWLNKYNHCKYWRRRQYLVDATIKKNRLYALYCLYYIKKVDAHWHCTFGTAYNDGSQFATPPLLYHGPNGIIIGYNAVIGRNCTICQHVTICQGPTTYIGDNVFIGAGAYISAGVKIGNNVRIGANAVVVEDIPDNATVVMQKPRIIIRDR